MTWEEFLHEDEKVQTKFEYKKRNTQQIIGVSDKRAFYYQKQKSLLLKTKKSESFLSSKFPIATLEYKLWTVPLWAWILNILGYIMVFLFLGIAGPDANSDEIVTIVGASTVLLIYLSTILIVLILNRKVVKIFATVGAENISITSRKTDVRKEAKDFMNETHALSSIQKAKSISSFKKGRRRLFLRAGVLICIVLFVVLFVAMGASIGY